MIPLPFKPKIIQQEDNWAIFEVEGCYPGYGITLGNAFRRVLLSSLSGAAVTGVKIRGVQHEFSTIPHIIENVINIILNLRQLRFMVNSEQNQFQLSLKVSGEKEVKAFDIKIPMGVEIINKDLHIASLTDKKANFEAEIFVETGLGYSSAEQRHKEKVEIGLILVDAIFTPIRRVNFEVEDMRVGERTDYNRLRFNIETDGSISPLNAFKQSAQILVDQFKIFIETEEGEKSSVKIKDKLPGEKKEKEAVEDRAEESAKISVEDLKLSTRVINALKEAGIKTVGGLAKKSEETLLKTEGLGEKGVKEIKRNLSKLGISLK